MFYLINFIYLIFETKIPRKDTTTYGLSPLYHFTFLPLSFFNFLYTYFSFTKKQNIHIKIG